MKAKIIPILDEKTTIRFKSLIKIKGDCWEFMSKGERGYGSFAFNSISYKAHRVAYQVFNNKILNPELTIDHLCMNRKCVNPKHLEEVSLKLNIQRAWIKNRKKEKKLSN